MKKLFSITCLILAICLLLLAPAEAASYKASEGTGEQTGDAAICTGPCFITGLLIITNGTDDATIIIYDNPSAASGTVRWEQTVTGADNYGGRNWAFPKFFNTGMYADIEGTGASYIIEKFDR